MRISDWSSDVCSSELTVQFLRELGLATPATYLSLASARQALGANELSFPVVVKPRWGSASIGIEYANDMETLDLSYRLAHRRIGQTILGHQSRHDLDHAILIQQKLQGDEYGLDRSEAHTSELQSLMRISYAD